ncbi:MAG: monovalent cation:proton antiporter-2 (CPA2) family protein [Pseudomonadota bacterium]
MIFEAIIFLTAAVLAVPLFKRLGLGAVLGYLIGGVAIGPYGLGLVGSEHGEHILHFSELGVVFLLFIIGLELRPSRLWAMRRPIFGFGSAQLLLTAAAIGGIAVALGLDATSAAIVGLILGLSSTAFALQLLSERGEMSTRHGRNAFATLLLQDIAVVPLLAMIPLLGSVAAEQGSRGTDALQAVLVLVGVVLGGRYVLRFALAIVARSQVREVLTATALLTVLGTAALVEYAGLSMALGAFLAGVLLADSEFRHQLEADIEPFKGLLLGLFFIAVGFTLDLSALLDAPGRILALVLALVAVKFCVLCALGKVVGLDTPAAVRLGIVLSQGGEFAFVLFGIAAAAGTLHTTLASQLVVVVSLSMITTPLLLALADRTLAGSEATGDEESLPAEFAPVLIAGFGRFGQIAARVLSARGIPFTALDSDHAQINFVKKYGNRVYYGDTTRLELLTAAGAKVARILILAIDDEAQSTKTAQLVRKHFPQITILGRALSRRHAYELMDANVQYVQRDTFLSSLDIARAALVGLGFNAQTAEDTIERFRTHDEHRLYEHRDSRNDEEKMQALAKEASRELQEMFERDVAEGVQGISSE